MACFFTPFLCLSQFKKVIKPQNLVFWDGKNLWYSKLFAVLSNKKSISWIFCFEFLKNLWKFFLERMSSKGFPFIDKWALVSSNFMASWHPKYIIIIIFNRWMLAKLKITPYHGGWFCGLSNFLLVTSSSLSKNCPYDSYRWFFYLINKMGNKLHALSEIIIKLMSTITLYSKNSALVTAQFMKAISVMKEEGERGHITE